jgi:hypothetical protein
MRSRKKVSQKFVVCINNSEYHASLELHKIYRIIPDINAESDGDLRVIDESGEDYLYPNSYFIPIKVPHKVEKSIINTV